MNEEVEKTTRSGADSISNDVVAGETQAVDIIDEKTINNEVNKEEIKGIEIENNSNKPIEQKININVDTKGKKPKKEKKNRNTRTTLLVLLVILVIALSIGVTYLKIQELKEKYKIEIEAESVFNEKVERSKSSEDDLLVEFGDKYNVNDIKITTYIDKDGVVEVNKGNNGPSNETNINRCYVQIEGMKNKDIQNSINDTLKNTVYSIDPGADGKISVYSYVQGNFSNILSVLIFYYEDGAKYQSYKCLNFDLNTGDIIKFEDLFVDSAPIASLIANAAMKSKAWQVDLDYDSMSEQEYFAKRQEMYDMNNRDFSNIEDYAIEIANLYKEKKNNIEFVVTPKNVTIYNFNTSFLKDQHRPFVINFMENKESIAAYKRFDHKLSLYENDIAPNDVYVFTSLYSGYYGFYHNEGNLYVNIYSYINNLDEKDANLLIREMENRVINEFKIKANANPDKKYVITGYANYADIKYQNIYYKEEDRYKDAYLINNGVKKSVYINYTLEVMDNIDNKRFGEIVAVLDNIPTASAEAYPISQLTNPYYIDDYAYLHIPEINTTRENVSYYYDEYGAYKTNSKELPSIEELQNYYYANELYYLGVDYGS